MSPGDNPHFDYSKMKSQCNQIGWDEHELYLATYSNCEPNYPKFHPNLMKQMLEISKGSKLELKERWHNFNLSIEEFIEKVNISAFIVLWLLFLILSTKKSRMVLLINFFFVFVSLFFFEYFEVGVLKPRVLSIFYYSSFFILIDRISIDFFRIESVFNKSYLLISLILIGANFNCFFGRVEKNNEWREINIVDFENLYEKINKLENLVICWLPVDFFYPFENPKYEMNSIRMGWLA
jgi:hypothetical protein